MGRADFFDLGNPNKICDGCGQKYKANELRKTWDNRWMCWYDWEIRQPQDKLRSFKDLQTIEDPRPEAVSQATSWDGSSLVTGTNDPSQDEFLDTNEVQSSDLGDGNGSICDVDPSNSVCP